MHLLVALLLVGWTISAGAFRRMAKWLALVAIPLGLVVVSWLLFNPGGSGPLLRVGSVTLYFSDRNISAATIAALRTLIWATSVILGTTILSLADFESALLYCGISWPFVVILSMLAGFWRFILRDATQVVEAQRARGLDFARGFKPGLFISRILSLTLPIIFVVLRRFRLVSFTLAIRGFGGGSSPDYDSRLPVSDWVFLVGAILFAGTLIIVDHFR